MTLTRLVSKFFFEVHKIFQKKYRIYFYILFWQRYAKNFFLTVISPAILILRTQVDLRFLERGFFCRKYVEERGHFNDIKNPLHFRLNAAQFQYAALIF